MWFFDYVVRGEDLSIDEVVNGRFDDVIDRIVDCKVG